ncbi:amino acid/polyamine/organocation transporter, APC superfamily [Lentzea waywayandensis]|uniref:Amino acid/polyamine/organocation transporter, APC superfamily n=1 Tax=Lentzea waywayandensis TaxID=84724 RepID=A0A1I6DAE8_9PSEU|nr:amino acid permease [Lentzea waywayandensis]SFR02414.1 amino acid/polyamine/organocation transporter, APC superfamily [Lentzea waywayandensis]
MTTGTAGPEATAPPEPGADQPRPSRFGLPTATALVVGSVIGTGVFGLPSALAAFGPISLVAFVLVTIGALALALTFGALSKRISGSGGPYVYARDAFGDFAGFLTAWCYWITAWAGNAAIVVALVGYVEVFVNTDHQVVWSIAIALAGLWIPALVNLSGLRNMAVTQILSVVLKFVPLLFMATVGLIFVKSANFGPFNASGTSVWGAISAAGAIALFSYIGIETASVAAGRVRDPERNVSRATVFGTIGCAVVYILGTLTVFGTVPNAALRDTKAPFTDAANAIFGGQWAGQTIAVAAVVSGLGCLIGWTLIIGEMPMAAAKDNLFPKAFLRTRRDIPSFGIISSTVLASALVIVSYTNFEQVFTTLVLLSVFTAVVPYLFSAAAQLYWLLVRGRRAEWPHLVRDCTVSVLALAFSFWALAGSGYQAVYYGVICLLLGVPLYIWLKVSRGEYGEVTS